MQVTAITQVNESPQVRRSDIRLLYAARCLRGFGDGFAVVILPAYLTAIGMSPVQIGFIATMSLLGTAVLTLLVGLIAPRHDLRNMLLLGAGLMVFTGIALPGFEYLTFIAAVAFVGTINPSTGDIGVLVPLEHAMLARNAADADRTRIFARYSLIGALSMAAGALAAGLADVFVAWGFTRPAAFKMMFYFYAALGVGAALALSAPAARQGRTVPAACAVGAVARHRLQAGGAVQPRCVRRRLHRPVAAGAVAVREVRHVGRRRRACSSSGRAC